MDPAPSFVSFFSGAGGFDLGFIEAGFSGLGAIDNNHAVLQIHSDNFEGMPSALLNLATERPPEEWAKRADVFLMGPPCQGFSTMAGVRFEDARNDLLIESARIVAHYKPSLAVIENVPGATNTRHRAHWIGTLEILKGAGYRVKVLRLAASDFGVPQTRRRNLIVAWRTRHDEMPELTRQPHLTVREALGDLIEAQGHEPTELDEHSRLGKIARGIGNGQRLSNVREGERYVHTWNLPSVFGTTTQAEREILHAILRLRRRSRSRNWGDADPVTLTQIKTAVDWDPTGDISTLTLKGYLRDKEGAIDLTHTFNGKHIRPPLDGLSPTIDTRVLDPHYFLHPTENRALTVREAARLQTFPDDFVFRVPRREAQRAIGNAVPPRLARVTATGIRRLLEP